LYRIPAVVRGVEGTVLSARKRGRTFPRSKLQRPVRISPFSQRSTQVRRGRAPCLKQGKVVLICTHLFDALLVRRTMLIRSLKILALVVAIVGGLSPLLKLATDDRQRLAQNQTNSQVVGSGNQSSTGPNIANSGSNSSISVGPSVRIDQRTNGSNSPAIVGSGNTVTVGK
jgi:hypothetical protein